MADPREPRRTNRLAQESSAYLRQHMHNPVDWYPWGSEALERARDEDLPILVSIGYSACHWCHVMAHESFEDPSTAALMNESFVNIKVDREERPDIDQIYMDLVTGLTGHGGWPLTAFCTSEARPFHGGTYYPPVARGGMPAFHDVLSGIAKAYRSRRGEVEHNATRILDALSNRPSGKAEKAPSAHCAAHAAMELLQRADLSNGGFGDAPKFPTPPSLDLLLAATDVLPEQKAREALEHVVHTCYEMARGGIYDQLGGGFHRYSVDARWEVPHFEKMLYDQGQLIRVYLEAWRRTGCNQRELIWPVEETIAYLRREMTGPEGAFYASQDADSEGAEGRFYVWTPTQLEASIGDAAVDIANAYDVSQSGNFEDGTSVLRDRARKPREQFFSERERLRRTREARIAPDTDPKRVAAWNGLTISGLARAASLLGDEQTLRDAATAADFVLDRMRDPQGRLLRIWNDGRAQVPAFLDDHSAMLEGLLDLYRAGGGNRYFEAALRLAEDIATRFYDDSGGDFFLSPCDGESLTLRPRSDHDGATPHSTGLAVLGLLRVAHLAAREDLARIADCVIDSHAFELERSPQAFPTLSRAVLARGRGLSLALIAGDSSDAATHALANRARRVLLPDDAVVIDAPDGPAPAGIASDWLADRGPIDGRPAAYICHGRSCALPVTEPESLAPPGGTSG
ncbi:MAG: thioredoxin domain-containing protein [Deltaproteobacteria bacterium]|nr:thioredoxin domain-containing protein [Deltaproteobacteria bacterium]